MPKKLSEDELLAIVDGEFTSAIGANDGEIGLERAKALRVYLSKPLGNEIDGQSKVVTSDVAEVIDSIMPSLLRIFTTADNLVSFDPVGEEDEAGAAQESDYVNYVFFKKNPAFLILFTWFFDALLQKNGIVKAWWDEREAVTTETYKGLTDEELAELLDDEELEPIERDERKETIRRPVPTIIGMIDQPVDMSVHDVTFKRTSKRGRVAVEAVPPEEYRISGNSRSLDPSGARMVGQERLVTRSELLEMGFEEDLVTDLPAEGTDVLSSTEKITRHDKSDEQQDVPRDTSQEKIRLREAYIRVDFDGDGKSELRQVFTVPAANKLLSNEPHDSQPFHVISPQPLPHKHFGRAVAEKVMDIQEVNTTLLRQMLDNLYHTNNPGHAVWEQGIGDNTLDDLLTTRVGRVARFNRPPQEAYAPMTVPFTAGATFPMLEFFDKVKRDRTGISSDSQGLSPDALKNIQISVLANAVDLSRMKVEAIARIFAETGIKSLFLHIHELLQKHQDKAQVVKLRNRWIEVNPQEWRTREDMTVNIGLGIGTREQNLFQLDAIWQKQIALATGGGMNLLVTPRNLFNTGAEYVKNANLKQPEMFFTDPGDKLAPPLPDQQQQLQAAETQLEQRRQALDARKQQIDVAELNLQRESEQLKHQRELMKLEVTHQEVENKLILGMEAIRNQLTELELKYGANVPGARV